MKRIFLLVCFSFLTVVCVPQLPIIKSNTAVISIRDGNIVKKNGWTVSPSTNPDVYKTNVAGDNHIVTFISDIDSISFRVKYGEGINFIILLNNKDSAFIRIVGSRTKEKATFTKQYIAAHNNKIITEVPEIYELFNIVLAITDIGKANRWMINKETGYYKLVLDWFDKYNHHEAIRILDSVLKKNTGLYTKLKQEAYCFEFNKKGKIIQSRIFDRMWGDANDLLPYITSLQDFSNKTHFRKFFKTNKPFYKQLISFYRDTANIPEMISWLRKNFPSANYNCFKTIFSPLVSGNQSGQGFSNNGFSEAQAHVNFPFKKDQFAPWLSLSSMQLAAGNIVFTEFNHSFINPESEKAEYAADVLVICKDLSHWMEDNAKRGYNSSYSCFNEYMNWVLVSLRYVDYADKKELPELLKANEDFMQKTRGFKKFPEFNKFLVSLYQNRKPGQVIADLYPQIIGWFKQNQ